MRSERHSPVGYRLVCMFTIPLGRRGRRGAYLETYSFLLVANAGYRVGLCSLLKTVFDESLECQSLRVSLFCRSVNQNALSFSVLSPPLYNLLSSRNDLLLPPPSSTTVVSLPRRIWSLSSNTSSVTGRTRNAFIMRNPYFRPTRSMSTTTASRMR